MWEHWYLSILYLSVKSLVEACHFYKKVLLIILFFRSLAYKKQSRDKGKLNRRSFYPFPLNLFDTEEPALLTKRVWLYYSGV